MAIWTQATTDLDWTRKVIREAEAIFALTTDLVDEDGNYRAGTKFGDRLDQLLHDIIDFRCDLEYMED